MDSKKKNKNYNFISCIISSWNNKGYNIVYVKR